jgi:hypothetical protein
LELLESFSISEAVSTVEAPVRVTVRSTNGIHVIVVSNTQIPISAEEWSAISSRATVRRPEVPVEQVIADELSKLGAKDEATVRRALQTVRLGGF